MVAALAAAAVEILQNERLAVLVAQRAVAVCPSGFGEQIARPLAGCPASCPAGWSRAARGTSSVKTFAGSFERSGSSSASSSGPGQPLRLEVAVVEEAPHAHVGIEHQLPVHPFEVERKRQRFAHARVLELARGAC